MCMEIMEDEGGKDDGLFSWNDIEVMKFDLSVI